MKIVILDGFTLNPGDLSWDDFKALGEVIYYDRTITEDIIHRIGDAEIIITNKTPLSAATIEACPNIKYIGVLATGYNVVDVDAAAKRNIPVCNIPSYGTSAVAQFVFAHLLNICHHLQDHVYSVKEGNWSSCPDFCYWDYPLTELSGKILGVIGYGRIGQAVGRIAQAFGMRVLAYDKHQNSSLECKSMSYTTIDKIFEQSDVISLHCPLFEDTEGIINKKNIGKMKDGVILINTSRGPLIVEEDLAEGLKSGKIRAAGLDVVVNEPILKDSILLSLENCFITPHIAWAPQESRKRLMDTAVSNLQSFLSGHVQNRVN